MTGTAGAALVAATLVPGTAASADENDSYLGTAEDFGVTAPDDGAAKLQDGTVSGANPAPSAYLIELRQRPVLKGGDAGAIEAEQQSFLAGAEDRGVDLEATATYDSVWNGVAVDASEAEVVEAAAADEVVAVYPVLTIERPEPQGDAEPEMESALAMTGADIAQSELGFTGEGIRVSIIDTGVDYDHPDFGGNGEDGSTEFPTDKVAFGYDFVGDDYNATRSDPAYSPTPQPDEDPDDCGGHGTHVAGIAAADGDTANDGVRGVAPDATIGAYRVFGCAGATTSDVMLSALERSFDHEMDVINMSIGSAFMTWPQYPTAQASDALVDNGVVVVASIGNSGAAGVYSAGAPGVGEDVIGVASFDNERVTAQAFTYGEDDTEVAYFPATGAPDAPTEGSEPIVRLGDPGSEAAQACTEFGGIDEDLTGQLVLIQRGTCTFHEKGVNAQEAGAEGVILYNNVGGFINATVEGDPPVEIPYVTITQDAGIALDDAIVAAGEEDVQITWTDETTSVENPTGGLISSFSSFGLTANLQLKPDIGAPGGSIRSTYPIESGSYATLSGTSMSAPHVAGAVALLEEADPDVGTHDVRDVLQNSADPAGLNLDPAAGLEPAHRQGAGMLDIDDAIRASVTDEDGPTVTARPGKLALGESGEPVEEPVPTTETVTLTNNGDTAVAYDVSHEAALATGGDTDAPGYYTNAATVVPVPPEVVVPAGGQVSVEVEITAPQVDSEVQMQYGGYVTFTSAVEGEEGDVLRVPYAGYAGDYQDIEVLTPSTVGGDAFDLPVLAKLTECQRFIGVDCVMGANWSVHPEGGVSYDLQEGDVPTALIHFDHQARSLTITAHEVNEDGSPGAAIGEVDHEDYLARSGAPAAFSAWTWDGKIDGQQVDDGQYILQASVLKALGDPENPEHTETWTSPAFTIDAVQETPVIDRFQGGNRYGTAAQISREFDVGPEVAYIATGQNYPDALAGAARAGMEHAPVLLTRSDNADGTPADRLPGATVIELERLEPQSIVILGGDDAVPEAVEDDLAGYTDGDVGRVDGGNRYGTAAEISAVHSPGVDFVYVATGQDYPDALAAASHAGSIEVPVLLTRSDGLPAATSDELERLQPGQIRVMGGTEAVSGPVMSELEGHTDGDVVRVEGNNRYGTAAEIAAQYEPGQEVTYLATGQDWPDALTGAALAGSTDRAVLLTRTDGLPNVTGDTLLELQPEPQHVTIFGGPAAVNDDVVTAVEQLWFTVE